MNVEIRLFILFTGWEINFEIFILHPYYSDCQGIKNLCRWKSGLEYALGFEIASLFGARLSLERS